MREHTETLNTQFAETLRKLRVEKDYHKHSSANSYLSTDPL